MENKELIISLIQHDFKHSQLVEGLKKLGLKSDLYTLNILE